MQRQFFPINNYRKDNIIFRKGDVGDRMYEVVEGSVGIYLHYRKENEKLLSVYEPGQFFGEIALLEVRPRTATAVALEEDTKLRVIFRKGYTDYFLEKPYTLTKILDLMSNRFKWQRLEYFDACKTVAELSDVLSGKTEMTEEMTGRMNKLKGDYEKFLVQQQSEDQKIEQTGSTYTNAKDVK